MEMELKSSPPKSGILSPSNFVSDPEEKEISDDDDDDRNHKHRRRETRSQSLERDPLELALTQPYRKRNRQFENGQSDPQSHYSLDRDISRFEKRRPPGGNFSRFSGDHGPGRGRGRDYQRDSRFGSVDAALQMAHPGSIPSAMFPGRGLPNVTNAASASWNGFGLIPPIPNGAIDAINPMGMPGMLRPQINPSLNMGIQRQRCRDFEERGYCLRGDMCPMEHGVNRIVVEDVQSLSQFNLPGSLPSAHLLGTSPGSGFVPSVSVSSSSVINSRSVHSRTSKSAADVNALNFEGAFSSTIHASAADVYDPDQPLWNSDGHETSTPLLGLQPSNFDESESLMDAELSDRLVRSSGEATGSQSTSSSVWGRISSAKNKIELKEKFDAKRKPLEYPESRAKEIHDGSGGTQATSHLGKQNNMSVVGPKTVGSASKLQNDIGSKKPTQKAQRTLFVNCIPLKDNKKENLLAHFRKFGEVIDIYIPANSERAFVQFSKREEAERALKAPDAVMGSRFIKLWWANRDSIADEGVNSRHNVSITPQDVPASAGLSRPAVVKGRDNFQLTAPKVVVQKTHDTLVTAGNDSKPVMVNGPKAPPPVQKKMEDLESLREQLRKKQEMLAQKRNEFRQQLDKLAIAKNATGKVEVSAGQATKKQKVETSTDAAATAGKSSDAVVSESSSPAEIMSNKIPNVEAIASQRSITNSAATPQEPLSMKQTIRPTASPGALFHVNRYKLDNRPTAFRIRAPLPAGLANVTALRDRFSTYGEITDVEIEELDEEENPIAITDSEKTRNCSARISFATRYSAEKAFSSGKSWNGHSLQFIWVTPSIPSSSRSSGESSSALRGAINSEVQSADKTTPDKINNTRSSSGPTESNSSPRKSTNEPMSEISRSGGRLNSPAKEDDRSFFEAQSPDRSASYIPLEADEQDSRDCEMQEAATGEGDIDMQPGKDPKASPMPLAESERVA